MNDALSKIDTYLRTIERLSEQVDGEVGERIRIEARLGRALVEKNTAKGPKRK